MTTSSLGTYFLLSFILAAVASVSSEDCTYTIKVKTGTVRGAGTNSKISIVLRTYTGAAVVNIDNLENHGEMGKGHAYFESGNVDLFTIRATCAEIPVCNLRLKSDGKGYKAGWYVEYVEVLITRGSSKAIGDSVKFQIDGWLATDEPPYSLQRDVNRCLGLLQENAARMSM